MEREKGGKVGAINSGGSGPCLRGLRGGKVRAHPQALALAGPGLDRAGAGSWTSCGSCHSEGLGGSTPRAEGLG